MPLSLGNIRVDISLCGGVARSQTSHSSFRGFSAPSTSAVLKDSRTLLHNARPTPSKVVISDPDGEGKNGIAPQRLRPNHRTSFNEEEDNDTMPTTDTTRIAAPFMIEPPKWAVPAKGESRLEPVCEAIGSHPIVDLTERAFVRVGRSPTSDLQLLHRTSSRRHALLFHHPNGSCYIVDCGSAHGTYVNGVRIQETRQTNGRVVPHRVRRGALVRFGGEGAPAFVFKSHAVGFSHLISDMNSPSEHPTLSPKPTTLHAQLTHRLKALAPHNRTAGGILKKRSWDSDSSDCCAAPPPTKRSRCSSPDDMPPSSPMRLVSPELTACKRVTFADDSNHLLVATVTFSTSTSESEGDDDEGA